MNLSKLLKLILTASIFFCLAACSYNFLPETDFFEDDVSRSFEEVLEIISSDDLSQLLEASIPELSSIENYEESIEQIFSLSGNATNAERLKAEIRFSDQTPGAYEIYYAVYEYKNGDNFDLLELALQESDEKCCYLRHINLKKNDFRSATYFDFKSQKLDFKRVSFIALMISTLIFIIFSLILVIKDKNLKLKWLWVMVVIFGTYGLTLNWTTGDINLNFISVSHNGGVRLSMIKLNLLGGGFQRADIFQPWILNWGFPLGAVAYFIKRATFKKKI